MAELSFDRTIEDMSFKEASIELEQVVRALEGGDLELEDSLSYYARGVELLKSLRERLAGAEQRVQVLMVDAEGGADAITVNTTSAPTTSYVNE